MIWDDHFDRDWHGPLYISPYPLPINSQLFDITLDNRLTAPFGVWENRAQTMSIHEFRYTDKIGCLGGRSHG